MENRIGNILIVDDNLDNLNVLGGMLAERDYKIRRAINGAIALRTIEANPPDLILLDIILPDITGYEICSQLKQNPQTSPIPIIFISALNDTQDKVKAFDVGGVDYICKPFEMAEVCARIQSQLEIQFAKTEIEQLNISLEQRVKERTAELTAAKTTLEQQIAERLWAEQALRHSESKFRAMIENASDLIVVLDHQCLVHYVSPSVFRSLGYVSTDLMGQPLMHWLHPQDREKAIQLFSRLFEKPGMAAFPVDLRWQHQEGHWCIFESIAQKFTDAMGFSGIVVNARDITERLRVEAMQCALAQEKELSELKLRFFSMTSHEFRTPLSVILMAAQILENSELNGEDPKRSRNIQRIQSSAQYLKQMLSDILDIARLEAQQMEFSPRLMCLKTVCDRILETQQTMLNGIPRINYIYHGEATEVNLDPQLLHSILNNLVANAIKYSGPDQSIQCQVTLTPEQVTLTISDQGIGIPPTSQDQLFEAFHRGDNVGQIEGSGLGLAIVKKCVDLHGGQITFDSIENKGTTFRVQLPIQRSIHEPVGNTLVTEGLKGDL